MIFDFDILKAFSVDVKKEQARLHRRQPVQNSGDIVIFLFFFLDMI